MPIPVRVAMVPHCSESKVDRRKMNFPPLRMIRRKLAILRAQLPEQAAATVISAIRARTRAGRDVAGRTFTPYSKEYVKRKRHPGVGGSLLERLVWRRTGEGRGRIEFAGRRGRLSAGHLVEIHVRGLGRMPRRDFAGWRPGSGEDQAMRADLQTYVRRALKR